MTERLQFTRLDVNGQGYKLWESNVDIHITAMDLPADWRTKPVHKAKVLCFLRQHMANELLDQYRTVLDPTVLRETLKRRFGQLNAVLLPAAEHAWEHLRFEDFKTVAEYNKTVFNLKSQLESYGGVVPTDTAIINKTLSTLGPPNTVLAQQLSLLELTSYEDLFVKLIGLEQKSVIIKVNHNMRASLLSTTDWHKQQSCTTNG